MTVIRFIQHLFFLGKNKLWDYIEGFNNDKLYTLKTSDVIKSYLDDKTSNLEEFAARYTFDYHEIRRLQDNKKSKINMYNTILNLMYGLRKSGDID